MVVTFLPAELFQKRKDSRPVKKPFDKLVDGEQVPAAASSPVFAEILQISGRDNGKKTALLRKWVFAERILPYPLYSRPGSMDTRRAAALSGVY